MSRRTQAPKRTILPDPKYGSELLAKFMNMIMNDGKKSVAERIIYGALNRIVEKETQADDKALELLGEGGGEHHGLAGAVAGSSSSGLLGGRHMCSAVA